MSRLLILLDLCIVGVSIWRYRYIPDEIPLFYSRPWGDDQLVEYWYLILLPILMHVFYVLNISISKRLFAHDTIAKHILRWVNNISIIALTSLYIRIILLIT